MLATLTFAQLLHRCAPNIGPRTMTAIVRVESDGQPLVIHDNTLNRTFVPHDANQGVVWAEQLIGLHHSVDLGLAQINSANLGRLGITIRQAFDPCINLHGGATILSADYASAAGQFGAGQYALRRAIGAYNTGSLYGGSAYIAQILAAAGLGADDDFVPDLERLGPPVSFLQGGAPRLNVVLPPVRPPHARPPDRRAAAAAAPILATPGTTVDAFHSPILVTANDGTSRPAQAPHPLGAALPVPAPTSPNAPVVLSADRPPVAALPVAVPHAAMPASASAASPIVIVTVTPPPALPVPGTPKIVAPPVVPPAAQPGTTPAG